MVLVQIAAQLRDQLQRMERATLQHDCFNQSISSSIIATAADQLPISSGFREFLCFRFPRTCFMLDPNRHTYPDYPYPSFT